MNRLSTIILSVFFVFTIIGCGGAEQEGVDTEYNNTAKRMKSYQNISKNKLQGTWTCTRYVFDNGTEQEFMAKRMPKVIFTDNKVNYMMQDYNYEIKNKGIVLTLEGKSVDATPFVYDGKSLVQVGDNAKVFYTKEQ